MNQVVMYSEDRNFCFGSKTSSLSFYLSVFVALLMTSEPSLFPEEDFYVHLKALF